MVLSQTAIYAMKASVHLASVSGSGPVRVDDIATALDVPRNYLSKILLVLAKEGILDSTRGPHGGFELATSPDHLFLSTVVAPFDDIAGGSNCLLGRERCSDADPCAAHDSWRAASAAMTTCLRETSVADIARTT